MKKDKDKILLTITEFSKLTKIPKERLRFYDIEGIISPAIKANNGYRYYYSEQMFQMFLIMILVKLNCYSLNEIKLLIHDKNIRFGKLLEDWHEMLQPKLIKMQEELSYTEIQIQRQNFLNQFENDKIYFVNYLYGPLLKTPIDPPNYPFDNDTLEKFSEHSNICIENDKTTIGLVSMSLTKEDFLSGEYKISNYCNLIYTIPFDKLNNESNKKKTLYYQHNGKLSDTKEILDMLNKFIRENNIIIKDELYITIYANNFENYVNVNSTIRILIPIYEETYDAASNSFIDEDFIPSEYNPFNNVKPDTLYASGKFADLCNISKETLRFYNRKKLLMPNYVSKNGYKYYYGDQLDSYFFIKMLQKSGASLKEIKELFIDQTTTYYDILVNCSIRYKKSIEIFSHYLSMANSLLNIRKYFKEKQVSEEPKVIDYYIIPHKECHSNKKFEINSVEATKNIIKMTDMFFENENSIYFPVSLDMACEDFLNSSFLLIGHSLFDYKEYNKSQNLPKRKYLCFHKVIPYSDIPENLTMLQEYISRNNLTVIGNIRIIITLDKLSDAFNKIYLVYFHIPIA